MNNQNKNIVTIIISLILFITIIIITTSIMFISGIYGMYTSVKKVHECGVENPAQLDNGECPK